MRNHKEELGHINNANAHWGKGFMDKGHRVFHPYTRHNFKFPSHIKKDTIG